MTHAVHRGDLLSTGPLDAEERYHLLGLVKEAVELVKEMNAAHQAFAITAVRTVAIAGAAIGALAIASANVLLNNDDDNGTDKT